MYNYWTLMKKLIWLKILQGTSFIVETITGNSPITLTNSINSTIISLKQYGKCIQNGTPTPSVPVDIYCNNGALKMVDDELPSGFKRVLGFQCNNNAMWEIDNFHLRGSDTVRVSFSVTAACNVWGCYQSASATDNYDLYATVTEGGKYLRYADGTYNSYFSSANQGRRFDVVYTPTGSSGMPIDSTWEASTFESANDLLIGSTTITGTSSKLKGNLYGDFVVENGGVERLHLIPCERVSDNVLGYYDKVGETFYEPYTGFAGAISLGYDGSHCELAIVGTTETLTVSAVGAETQTVNDVSNLLAVGDYADTEELIAGIKTGKVGVYCASGESECYMPSENIFRIVLPNGKAEDSLDGLCTHYKFYRGSSTPAADKNFAIYKATYDGSPKCCFGVRDNSISTLDAFKDMLDEKRPIILYPLATETTEQTMPHSLHSYLGTTIVDAQTEVDPVKLEVSYETKSA